MQVFCQARPPKRVYFLTLENKRKVFFPRRQRRIASLRIEPGVNNISITKRQWKTTMLNVILTKTILHVFKHHFLESFCIIYIFNVGQPPMFFVAVILCFRL